jgi:hypothetical protein
MAEALNDYAVLQKLFKALNTKSFKVERQGCGETSDITNQLPTLDDGSKGDYDTPESRFYIDWETTEMLKGREEFSMDLVKIAKKLYTENIMSTNDLENKIFPKRICISTAIIFQNKVKSDIKSKFATEDTIRLRCHPKFRYMNST